MPFEPDRRNVLALAAFLGAAPSAAGAAAASKKVVDQPEFLWGAAGSSYQIEGGNYASEIWALEHVTPTIFKIPSGDAADTYNRVAEDIAMAASFGLNCHRFSIEWSRIEPERGQISRAGLDYYRHVLELCHNKGLVPVVTLNHWTVPRWFAEAGGFETTAGIEPFVNYCRLVTEHMGDLMGVVATLNEANIGAQLSWVPGLSGARPLINKMLNAAAIKSGSDTFSCPLWADFRAQQPILLEAHARAYDAIKAVQPKLAVGFTLSLSDDQAAGPDSALARKEVEVWLPWLGAKGDWIGVQTYSRARVGPTSDLHPEPGVELTQAGYEFWPQALEAVIRKVAVQGKRPIYVTENGISTSDDNQRVRYIKLALAGLDRCLADGIDVRGYIHWSLLDNWEWSSGYKQHFGLVAVDRETFARSPKPSAYILGQIAKEDLKKRRRR